MWSAFRASSAPASSATALRPARPCVPLDSHQSFAGLANRVQGGGLAIHEQQRLLQSLGTKPVLILPSHGLLDAEHEVPPA